MFAIFLYAINAVLPIILLILLGYFLRQKGFVGETFVKEGNKLVFRVALPAMLFYNVYNVGSLGEINWGIVWFSLGSIALLFLLGLVMAVLFVKDKRRKGVLLQCVFRSNYAIIGVPLAEALGGSEGVAVVAVMSAFIVPAFNALAVVALSIFTGEDGERPSVKEVLRRIVTNPLIIAVAAGLLALAVRSLLPKLGDGTPVFSLQRDLLFLYKTVETVSRMASPLALIVLGGQFVFSAAGKMLREIVLGTAWRTVLSPAIGLGLAILLNRLGLLRFGPAEYTALVALFGTPVAVSSAIMAGEMGNDEQLAGQYVVWTSLASMFTIFLFVVLLRSMGLI